LVITLTGITGEVIYRNLIPQVITYRQTLSENLPKGLYFLTVSSTQAVTVKKIIIQ
jgi:hypothetical protein